MNDRQRVQMRGGSEAVSPIGDGQDVTAVPPRPILEDGLVPRRNRVERIADQGKGLVNDVSDWVEVKLKLLQVEIEERIDARVNALAANAIVAALGLLGGVFLLVALAMGSAAILIELGLSSPLSYFLGFLLIALILGAAAAVVRSMRPHLLNVGKKERSVDEKKLSTGPRTRGQLSAKRDG